MIRVNAFLIIFTVYQQYKIFFIIQRHIIKDYSNSLIIILLIVAIIFNIQIKKTVQSGLFLILGNIRVINSLSPQGQLVVIFIVIVIMQSNFIIGIVTQLSLLLFYHR